MKAVRMATACLLVCALFLIPRVAKADQYPVKWSQMPDMGFLAIDILSLHRPNGPVVADDFRCTTDASIVGFHWWGSYLDNYLSPGGLLSFEVSFHPDVPAGVDTPFSHPGQPYQFQIVQATEIFFGTAANGERIYEYQAKLGTPWTQREGNIYWVDIAYDVGTNGLQLWGWHDSIMEWGDKAVATVVPGQGGNPHTGLWVPVCHNMAFEVQVVPIPSAVWLLGSGLLGLIGLKRKLIR